MLHVIATPNFLVKTEEGYEPNQDKDNVQLLCATWAKDANGKEYYQRFESKIISKEESIKPDVQLAFKTQIYDSLTQRGLIVFDKYGCNVIVK